MTPDYRALCAELLQTWDDLTWDDLPWGYDFKGIPVGQLAEIASAPFERARTALAQPEPEGVTDDPAPSGYAYRYPSIDGSVIRFNDGHEVNGCRPLHAIPYWLGQPPARPALKPVPVSERPWEREGWCDAEGKCWWGRPSEELCNSDWFLATRAEVEEFCDCFPPVVSLPAHALPVPEVTP